MEISNKIFFRSKLREKIERQIREFPLYFYGNILINIVVIGIIILSVILAFSIAGDFGPNDFTSGVGLIIIILGSILTVTIPSFLKNLRILNALRVGHYDLKIEDYELDSVVEFIEQLPMNKDDVERVRVSLSFSKLIDILDLFRIIKCKNGTYELDLAFKYDLENAFEQESLRK